VCYDELYLQQCTAEIFAEAVMRKTRDNVFQSFIIDAHGGRIREIASGVLPRIQYTRELEARGVRSVETGSGFYPGSDDIAGREMKLRDLLHVRAGGTTKMLVVMETCPNLVREFYRFKKKVVNGFITDEGMRRGNCHAIETCEYAAAHGMNYIQPPYKPIRDTVVTRIIKERNQREKQRRMNSSLRSGGYRSYINLGPTGE